MASHFALPLTELLSHSKSSGLVRKRKFGANVMEQKSSGLSSNRILVGYLFTCHTKSRWHPSLALSSRASSAHADHRNFSGKNEGVMAKNHIYEMEFNRVNCLIWLLRESTRSFSKAVESLGLAGSGPAVAMAWLGKDVHEWHKRIAHRVAIHALLRAAIDMETSLYHEQAYDIPQVREILTPLTKLNGDYIENQLEIRHKELVDWFRIVELPRLASYFIPLLKKWSTEYAGRNVSSGVAGMLVATTCCSAVGKLSYSHIPCSVLMLSVKGALAEFIGFLNNLIPVEKLHRLSIEAGFEMDFLSHFGTKVLSHEQGGALEFWIGLAHKKLSKAFYDESIFPDKWQLHSKVQADTLATLGLFAYLGRRTRVFLSAEGMKDLSAIVKDFLSYLECGSLFIYPEFSSISVYQLFMEVVTDEIGWLDFYANHACTDHQQRRKSQQILQAEKESILSACCNVFTGFNHFIHSTEQPLSAAALEFLLNGRSLLNICLEKYWAAHDKSGLIVPSSEVPMIVEKVASHDLPSFEGDTNAPKPSLVQQISHDALIEDRSILKKWRATIASGIDVRNLVEAAYFDTSNHVKDIWMGTQLLFIDISVALELVLRQVHGHKATRRERKRLRRTLDDIAALVPITILMLLPVSAVGHAAILAAIKKYTPHTIPSPYSSERLDAVKQLEHTKKMDVLSLSNPEDPSHMIS